MRTAVRRCKVTEDMGTGVRRQPLRPDFSHETLEARQTRSRTVRGVPTALGLFVGGGGLDHGFRRAGFRLLAATDIDPVAQKTHERNWPRVPFILGDLRTIRIETLATAMRGRRPDVIVGGPPCQGFSTLGDRRSADPRNELVDAFARIVDAFRPQAVLVENVRAIVTEYKGRYRDYVLERFHDIGYRLSWTVLNAADYGVPQHRRRAFFIGFADPHIAYSFPTPTHGPGLLPYASVGAAIADLADRDGDVPNHSVLRHTDRVLSRYRLVPEGGMLPPPDALPKAIRRDNFGSTYKRLHRDAPSLTIVPGNNALPIHPFLDRSLTPREAARIQTFPDDYIFQGDRRQQCIQVGNAVPPQMAYVLAHSVWDRILPLKGVAARLDSRPSVELVGSPVPRRRRPSVPVEGPTFVDLFCGAGGFTLGFARAGLRPAACADNNARVAETHARNFPNVPFVLGDLSRPDIQSKIVCSVEPEPFVVVGGPPCQGFSVFGKRRLSSRRPDRPRLDPRNRLVFSFIDVVAELMPRWVVLENVPGFASLDQGDFVRTLVTELRLLQYSSVEFRILDAADYGVPQRRRRFLLIANRTGHIIPWPKQKFFEAPTEWQKPFRTVDEAIADLSEETSYARHSSHVPMNHRPLQVERYRRIPEGGRLDIDSLPLELRRGYRTDVVKNFSHVFKRLHRARPSTTLVPGHNAFPVHPWLDRTLTAREAARLQTFPDYFEFTGSREDQCIQVGNAFPPLLAEVIANNLIKAESNGWVPDALPKLAAYSLVDVSPGSEQEELALAARPCNARGMERNLETGARYVAGV